ncbi:MAG: hypothetical protein FJ056_02270 [Cyanobacteria bacterium M_surface_10_m2_179]|nr:hypothetical protein [Cyanobacteria bacterium M_surface_10_m2_179]
MSYTIYSHDAWGTANVGTFSSLEEARAVFQTLQNDRWFVADGGVRRLSIVDNSAAPGGSALEGFSFPAG